VINDIIYSCIVVRYIPHWEKKRYCAIRDLARMVVQSVDSSDSQDWQQYRGTTILEAANPLFSLIRASVPTQKQNTCC